MKENVKYSKLMGQEEERNEIHKYVEDTVIEECGKDEKDNCEQAKS